MVYVLIATEESIVAWEILPKWSKFFVRFA
jgi:hypothetical protein